MRNNSPRWPWGKAGLAAGSAVLLVTTLNSAAQENWSFDASPYLWVASLDVATSLPDTPAGVGRFDTRISAGAMLAAEARYRSLGVFVDFAWLRLDTEALHSGPAFSAVDLTSDFIHTTMALTYRLPMPGKFHADVLAGARVWNVNEELEFKSGVLPGFKTAGDRTWVDPVVGANLRYDLCSRWSMAAKGTVGGFGVSTDLAWEVFSGVNYRFTDWSSVTLGYRYLHEDYDRRAFALNLDAHGFLLGFGFHF